MGISNISARLLKVFTIFENSNDHRHLRRVTEHLLQSHHLLGEMAANFSDFGRCSEFSRFFKISGIFV